MRPLLYEDFYAASPLAIAVGAYVLGSSGLSMVLASRRLLDKTLQHGTFLDFALVTTPLLIGCLGGMLHISYFRFVLSEGPVTVNHPMIVSAWLCLLFALGGAILGLLPSLVAFRNRLVQRLK